MNRKFELTGIDMDIDFEDRLRPYIRFDETTNERIIRGQHCDLESEVALLLLKNRDALKAKIELIADICRGERL